MVCIKKRTDPNNDFDEQILEAILLTFENLPIDQASEKLKNTLLGTIINVILSSRQKDK